MINKFIKDVITKIDWMEVISHIVREREKIIPIFNRFRSQIKFNSKNNIEGVDKLDKEVLSKKNIIEHVVVPKESLKIFTKPDLTKNNISKQIPIDNLPKQIPLISKLTYKEIWALPNEHKFLRIFGGLATTFFVFFKCALQGSWWMLLLYLIIFILIIIFLWYLPTIIKKLFKSNKSEDFSKLFSGAQLCTVGMFMTLLPKTIARADSTLLEAPGGVSILREYTYEEKLAWLTNLKELFRSNGLKPEQINLIFSNIDLNVIQSYQHLLQLIIERKRLVLDLITESFNNKNIKISWYQSIWEFTCNHPWITITAAIIFSFYVYYIFKGNSEPKGSALVDDERW